jgi:hypothetical protein
LSHSASQLTRQTSITFIEGLHRDPSSVGCNCPIFFYSTRPMLTFFPRPHSFDYGISTSVPQCVFALRAHERGKRNFIQFLLASVLTYRRVHSVVVLEAFVCCLTWFRCFLISLDSVLLAAIICGRVHIYFPCTLPSLPNPCTAPYRIPPHSNPIVVHEKEYLHITVILDLPCRSLYVDNTFSE